MVEELLFVIGRIIFGGLLAFMGVNHFQNTEDMVGYAKFKGVPAPRLAVLGTGAMLVLGGLSLALGLFPLVGIILLALFFVGVTPKMHDFWAQEGEQKQTEMVQFLKNLALFGATLVFAYTLQFDWPFAITQ